jgi:alpha-ribazole phosphatase
MPRGLIIAVRHPRALPGARICHGRTDAPLAEPAEAAADKLLTQLDEPIDRIISSPLRRALDVARLVAQRTGAPLHADDRLIDQDYGTWEGQPWSSLPRTETIAWEADPVHYSPGGGESASAMLRRLRRAWTRLASSEDTTLVITHAAPIQCLIHIATGLKLTDALSRSIPFGAITRLEGT